MLFVDCSDNSPNSIKLCGRHWMHGLVIAVEEERHKNMNTRDE